MNPGGLSTWVKLWPCPPSSQDNEQSACHRTINEAKEATKPCTPRDEDLRKNTTKQVFHQANKEAKGPTWTAQILRAAFGLSYRWSCMTTNPFNLRVLIRMPLVYLLHRSKLWHNRSGWEPWFYISYFVFRLLSLWQINVFYIYLNLTDWLSGVNNIFFFLCKAM